MLIPLRNCHNLEVDRVRVLCIHTYIYIYIQNLLNGGCTRAVVIHPHVSRGFLARGRFTADKFERSLSTTTKVVVGIQWATTTTVVVGIERVTTTTVVVGIKWVKV